MNLLAAPWSDAVARALLAINHRRLRLPAICVASSALLVGVGNGILSTQVATTEVERASIARRRAEFDRSIAGTHVRERRLRRDLAIARRMAAIRRDADDTIAEVAELANATPRRVWFGSLIVDRTHLEIVAKADSFIAVSTMLRSSARVAGEKNPRVRSIARSANASIPLVSFTLELQRGS